MLAAWCEQLGCVIAWHICQYVALAVCYHLFSPMFLLTLTSIDQIIQCPCTQLCQRQWDHRGFWEIKQVHPHCVSVPYTVYVYCADSLFSHLKRALTFGFRGGWLVNGARASPTNFSSSCMGAQRPVICFLDQPIIHVTFGLVEYSNLITVSASGRKSISLTVMDTEFDLAWAYYCTVFGGKNMELYVPQNNPYIVFSTYPSNNSELLCVFTHFVYWDLHVRP